MQGGLSDEIMRKLQGNHDYITTKESLEYYYKFTF